MIAGARRVGGAFGLVQHAVIAVAHTQPVLERLDMDVGGLRLDRAGDDLVDQPDDRRLARQILEPLRIILEHLPARRLRVRRFFARTRFRIEAVECVFEFDRDRDLADDGTSGRCRDGCRREAVQRVGHRQHERAVMRGHWDDARMAEEGRLQAIRYNCLRWVAIRGHDRQAKHGTISFGEAALSDQSQLDEHAFQGLAVLVRHLTGALDRLEIALATRDQDFREVVAFVLRACFGQVRIQVTPPRPCMAGIGRV